MSRLKINTDSRASSKTFPRHSVAGKRFENGSQGMKTMRKNKKSRIALLIFLSLLLSSAISAEETSKKQSTNSDTKEDVFDEIKVLGDRSLFSLRREAIKAQELKYEIFNSLNSTDEFDITCEMIAPIGSHISDIQLAAENAHKTKALNKEMKDLAAKHPELVTAMIRGNEINKLYEAERRKRFKNSVLIGHPEPEENNVNFSEFDIWQAVFVDHMRGSTPDDIWKRWDSWCRNKLQEKSYRALWASDDKNQYVDEFKAYINSIISGE